MALEPALRAIGPTDRRGLPGLRRAEQGWGPEDYRIYFSSNSDWGRIHIIFVVADVPAEMTYEPMGSVMDYLHEQLARTSPELARVAQS